MGLGIPATHTERCSLGSQYSQTALRNAVRASVEALGWQIKHESTDQILAATPLSWDSYGERVTINFQSDGALMVSSRCVFPLQVIDWGKNAANIKQLLDAVEQQVLPQSLSKTS